MLVVRRQTLALSPCLTDFAFSTPREKNTRSPSAPKPGAKPVLLTRSGSPPSIDAT